MLNTFFLLIEFFLRSLTVTNVAIAVTVHLAYRLYKIIYSPIVYVKDMRIDNPHPREHQRCHENDFPNGWIAVGFTDFVKPGEVKTVNFCGKQIVIFRGFSNKLHVIDAYCPHLGANFAAGGRIHNIDKKDCIECPFHGWTFDAADGKCVSIPYSQGKIPNGIRIKVWHSLEIHDLILIWHHNNDHPPDWYPPQIPGIVNGDYHFDGYTEHHIGCHMQEIAENGADTSHFKSIHSPEFKEFISWMPSILRHEWIPSWKACDSPDEHQSEVTLIYRFYIKDCQIFEMTLDIRQIGPAIVYIHYRFNLFGAYFHGVYIQMIIPCGVYHQRLIHRLYSKRQWFSHLLSRWFLYGEAYMLEKDILQWTWKVLLKNPKLVKEDTTLKKFRKWYSQFYQGSKDLDNIKGPLPCDINLNSF